MSKPVFTSGPWEVVPLSGIGGPYAIRQPYDDKRKFFGIQCVHSKADAQLIASAPEMYEVLLRIKTLLDEKWSGYYGTVYPLIENVLAKAEGREVR